MSEPLQPSSEELARAAQEGSLVAFEALVLRFERPLFRFLRLRAQGDADAEELAQATFVRAFCQLRRYDAGRPFASWLFTIGRHLAVSQHRSRERRAAPPVPADLASREPGPPEASSSREEGRNLWELAAAVLTPDQRSAVWLRYVEDLPTAEIGRVLGVRTATVRVLLFRARRLLARHLAPETPAPVRPAGRAAGVEPERTKPLVARPGTRPASPAVSASLLGELGSLPPAATTPLAWRS